MFFLSLFASSTHTDYNTTHHAANPNNGRSNKLFHDRSRFVVCWRRRGWIKKRRIITTAVDLNKRSSQWSQVSFSSLSSFMTSCVALLEFSRYRITIFFTRLLLLFFLRSPIQWDRQKSASQWTLENNWISRFVVEEDEHKLVNLLWEECCFFVVILVRAKKSSEMRTRFTVKALECRFLCLSQLRRKWQDAREWRWVRKKFNISHHDESCVKWIFTIAQTGFTLETIINSLEWPCHFRNGDDEQKNFNTLRKSLFLIQKCCF